MKTTFKIADIIKIEIFAPGTAGERAIRIETKDGVEIFDQDSFNILNFEKDDKVLVDIHLSQDSEAHNVCTVIRVIGLEVESFENSNSFESETFGEAWLKSINFLEERGLPCPGLEDMNIEEERGGYKYAYWEAE